MQSRSPSSARNTRPSVTGIALLSCYQRWLESSQQPIKHHFGLLPHIVAILKLLHVRLKVLPGNVNVGPRKSTASDAPKTPQGR